MIRLAAQLTVRARHYATRSLAEAAGPAALFDVVSASSLLVTSEQPVQMLQELKQRVRPGGKLLLVEAAPALTLLRSIRLLLRQPAGKRGCMLLLWAAVRSGKTLPEAFFKDDRWKPDCTSVLDGMVHVWLLERPAGLFAGTSSQIVARLRRLALTGPACSDKCLTPKSGQLIFVVCWDGPHDGGTPR
jgi:SAM-dependent methyltransferase